MVDAIDLANYYRTDAATADQRFRKRSFKLQGEIAAFERPPFLREYRILLNTADRELRIVCDFSAPEKYSAVLTIKNGSELVGQMAGRNRERIAKVGDTVVIRGQCRGLSSSAVKMIGCELMSIR